MKILLLVQSLIKRLLEIWCYFYWQHHRLIKTTDICLESTLFRLLSHPVPYYLLPFFHSTRKGRKIHPDTDYFTVIGQIRSGIAFLCYLL